MVIEDLKNRLLKQFKHYQKWANKQAISYYRLYDKDLPDYPCRIDWVDSSIICWIYNRKKDDTDDKKLVYKKNITDTLESTFNVTENQLVIKSRQQQKGIQNQYKKVSNQSDFKIIVENNITFKLNLSDYLDIGLFLDHRKTRQLVQTISANKRVLNLFSYTGGFTCYAIAGGALATTSVDMNKNYIEWTKENVALNEFKKRASDRFICDNVFSFLNQEQSKNKYDVIICDPPTFSNSKKMTQSFSINDDYQNLLSLCIRLLETGGTLIFSCNSKSFNLDETSFSSTIKFENITKKTIDFDCKNKQAHHCWLITKN